MTLLYYGVYGAMGGMENYAKTLLLGLREQGVNVLILWPFEGDTFSFRDELVAAGCQVCRVPNPKRHPVAFRKALLALAAAQTDDCVLQLNICSYRNFGLFSAARSLKTKVVVVSHASGVEGPLSKIVHAIGKRLYRRVGSHVAVSDTSGRFMFVKNDYQVINNGIAASSFSFNSDERSAVREEFKLGDSFAIGQVGRFCIDKNQSFSIRLLNRLVVEGLDVKLVFVGSGDHSALSKDISALGLSDRVIFAGVQSERMSCLYSSFDAFILPSLREGMSLALLEAVASGLTCLVSDNVPLPALEGAPIISAPLDEGKWADGIKRIRENGSSQRANYVIPSDYDEKVFINHYLDLYRLLVGKC